MKKRKLEGTKKNLPNTSSINSNSQQDIFPPNCQYVVFLLTLVIRIYYVIQPSNWWILHPDEIYQSMEVAHSEVYGYGFRPYEYLSSVSTLNDTRLRQREIQLGMAAMRSFIYPGFFILVSQLVELLCLHVRPFLVWKISHAITTSFLPLSVFMFSKGLFQSYDVGALSGVLVACSVHLNVFGTHTLVNSFLAPFVFVSLAVLIAAIGGGKGNEVRVVSAHTTKSIDCSIDQQMYLPVISLENGIEKFSALLKSYNIIPRGIHDLKKPNDLIIRRSVHIKNNNLIGLNFLQLHLPPCCASFVLATCCYIRPDLTVCTLIIMLPHIRMSLFESWMILTAAIGTSASLVVCVWCDFVTYGYGVISPWNWFNFNILHHFSASLFGTMNSTFYIKSIFLEDTFNSVLLLIGTALLFWLVLRCDQIYNLHSILKLLFSFAILLLLYSLQSHKEPRHIHNLFCVFYIIISGIVISFLKLSYQQYSSRICILLLSVSFVFSAYQQFPSPSDKSNLSWVYGNTYDANDVNMCLDYIGRNDDVTAVFMDRSIHMSGGYSILHKDVPFLTLMIHEFNEFDQSSRLNFTSTLRSRNVSISTFSRGSNFISVLNTPYLLKVLINKPKYNYLVLRQSREFIDYGYKKVFSSGEMKVMRRLFHKEHEKRLLETEKRIPTGSNATVLNYEGNKLFDIGALEMATERLEASMSLDPQFINNYQLLSNLYFTRGDKQLALNIMAKCYRLHDKQSCMTLSSQRILHSTYDITL